jgi:hypothetical protein
VIFFENLPIFFNKSDFLSSQKVGHVIGLIGKNFLAQAREEKSDFSQKSDFLSKFAQAREEKSEFSQKSDFLSKFFSPKSEKRNPIKPEKSEFSQRFLFKVFLAQAREEKSYFPKNRISYQSHQKVGHIVGLIGMNFSLKAREIQAREIRFFPKIGFLIKPKVGHIVGLIGMNFSLKAREIQAREIRFFQKIGFLIKKWARLSD